MKRIFNTAGPCDPLKHYMIDASRRLGAEVLSLIDEEQFFVVHAARQSGKTTLLMDLAERVNAEGKYFASYCALDQADGIVDPKEGIPAIIHYIKTSLKLYCLPDASSFAVDLDMSQYSEALSRSFVDYCKTLNKPLVLFFDEADCLGGQTLISFLRQLRNGYVNRSKAPFVHSLALVGMRNIRDYRDEYRSPDRTLGSASPFNVVSASLTLRNFTGGEVAELYGQHTADTGQAFTPEAVNRVWEQTSGQPWLVNAIAREIVRNITRGDPLQSVTADMVDTAIQTLILQRGTHFDSLMARLKEPRVRRVLEPILLVEDIVIDFLSDDYNYVKDLGLIRDDRGKKEPANPIYAEVIVRALNWGIQESIFDGDNPYKPPRYLKDGKLDMDILLRDFQVFWRENGAIWRERNEYKEAAPQLILQAFLQRVINGGGQIVREFAAARRRADLCVVYAGQKYPIELKIRRSDKTYTDGIEQIAGYMDLLGCRRGWLVVFDNREDIPWEEKLFVKIQAAGEREITVVGC
jgi:hypothetical protein